MDNPVTEEVKALYKFAKRRNKITRAQMQEIKMAFVKCVEFIDEQEWPESVKHLLK